MKEQIKKYEDQKTELQVKIQQLSDLIVEKFNHSICLTLMADKRHYEIKLRACEYKLNQLKLGLPILGEPECLNIHVNIEQQVSTNKINYKN